MPNNTVDELFEIAARNQGFKSLKELAEFCKSHSFDRDNHEYCEYADDNPYRSKTKQKGADQI